MNCRRVIAISAVGLVLLTVVATSVPDQPDSNRTGELRLLKARVKMLESNNKSKDLDIAKLKGQVARLGEQAKDLKKKVAKLERLCRENGIEYQTPAEKVQAKQAEDSKKAQAKKAADAKFKRLHAKYKNKYACVGGKYVRLPEFDLLFLLFPNSRGPRALDTRRMGGAFSPYSTLREQKVGAFGHFGWCTIINVLGTDKMLVRVPYTGKRLPPIILQGWPTKGLVDDQTWYGDRPPAKKGSRNSGADIAIIGTESYRTVLGSGRTVLLAIPLTQVREGLTEKQFAEMLKQGISPEKGAKKGR